MKDFHAYVPWVNRQDLLKRLLWSVPSLWDDLMIVDNSEQEIMCDLPDGVEVYRPPVPLSFSQTQNLFFADAKERGCRFAVWMHNDVEVPEGVFPELLEMARKQEGLWGVLYTFYDIVSVVNVEAALDIGGYDTNIRAYKSDQDFYHRLRLAGWETRESHLKVEELRAAHLGSQTIKSDPVLAKMNGVVIQVDAEYYRMKWGGEAGREKFLTPFNG